MTQLILFNKPFQVLSQFTCSESNKETLARFIKEPNVYAAGRLDYDSEGLLLLTDNGQLQHRIAHPKHKSVKTYWAQVEGTPADDKIKQLCKGILLKDGLTLPAQVKAIDEPHIWERVPPIRSRANIPTTWLEIKIHEGRNRQVRRMTAAIGHPTLRLIRASIGKWDLSGLMPGEYKKVTIEDIEDIEEAKAQPKIKRKPSYPAKGKFGKMRPPVKRQ